MMTEIEKAYISGIVDGEGNIAIAKYKEKPFKRNDRMRYRLFVAITNTNLNLISYLSEKIRSFNIYFLLKKRKRNIKHKDIYVIQMMDFQAEKFLKMINNYLLVKKEQAGIAFEFRKTFIKKWGRTKVPKYLMEKREEYFQKMKELNKRGHI